MNRKFTSTEKFFQVSLLLELEAQTGSKIFSEDYVTGGTFLRQLVELFLSEIFGNARFFLIFAHFKTSLDRMSGIFVFLNQFSVNFRKVTLASGVNPFKISEWDPWGLVLLLIPLYYTSATLATANTIKVLIRPHLY